MKEKIIKNDLKKQKALCAALRENIFYDETKGRYTPESRQCLKKLYLFEALTFEKNFTGAVNLAELSSSICGAAYLSRTDFSSEIIYESGTHYINVRLFEIMLSIIAKYTGGKIRLNIGKNYILVTVSRLPENDYLNICLKSLNALKLENYRRGTSRIIIPLKNIKGSEISPKNEVHYLTDKYSVFNVY